MFITCSFNEDGTGRAYTYACDLEDPIEQGARVVVHGPRGDEKTVTVVDTDVPEPPFECKQVLRVKKPDEAGDEGDEQ